jgi:polar amino acid transport system substrate-binding protein
MRKMTTLVISLMAGMMLFHTALADDLINVKKKGEISMAMSGQYPPFNFVDDKNHLTGFDVEIGKEIAKRIGITGVPMTTAWDGIIAGLLANKYELICGSMAITEKVGDRVIFMADGVVVEDSPPKEMFRDPKELRTQQFLSEILK